jgi:phage protein D
MSELSPPGTRFFAPQARFVDADSGQVLHGDSPADVDLISTRVTQTNHGVGQMTLTLNNQRHVDGRPAQPPWKYNDLATLKFGQRLRVEVRYGGEAWKPLILARVTDMNFDFPAGGGAQVTVVGEDLLSLFKSKPVEDKRYRNQQELEIVRDVLTRSRTGLSLADPPLVPRPTFSETLSTVTHQKAQTYLQFLESLAERLDFEVFVDFDDPTNPESDVRFHFEPARSRSRGTVVDLAWGTNLVSFSPRFKVWQQFTGASARGRHPRNRRRIEQSVAADAITVDLHAEGSGPAPINAIEARQRFFADENNPEENAEPVDVSNLDEERALLKAQAALRARARELLTARATTFGFTELRPGVHVNIQNLYAPFDGLYYVTQAVHTLDSGGFKTECTLRRPGMLPPEGYPAAS